MGEHILLCSRYLVHLLRGSGACLERGDRRVRALHRARKVNAERHRRGIQFEDADELLNEKLFLGLGHARSAVAEWVADDNTNRPTLPAVTKPRRPLPPNSPQWTVDSTKWKRSADRSLLLLSNRAIVIYRLGFRLDERRAAQQPLNPSDSRRESFQDRVLQQCARALGFCLRIADRISARRYMRRSVPPPRIGTTPALRRTA